MKSRGLPIGDRHGGLGGFSRKKGIPDYSCPMEPLIYALSGIAMGWLFTWWLGERKGMQVFKTILLGGVGGIAGGYLAKVLIDLLESLAPLAGGALGAFVLLVFVREKQESNRRQKQQD